MLNSMLHISEYTWMQLAVVFMLYVLIRAVFLQGGIYLFTNFSSWAKRHRIYKIDYAENQLKSELKATLRTIVVDGITLALLLKFYSVPSTKENIFLTFAIAFVWFEIWFYFTHYFFHKKEFYFIHKQHHVAKVTSPLTAMSFSVLERLILILGGVGFIMTLFNVLPLSFIGIEIYLFTNYLLNLAGHLNIEFVPSKLLKIPLFRILNAPTYHALHHARYQGHYGLFTPFLDRIFKTNFTDYLSVQEHAYKEQGLQSFQLKLY